MPRGPDREVVRRANQIEEIIPALTGDPVQGNGTERLTTCPFHQDQHPSLRVNVDKQEWYCDPCGVGGDVFELVKKVRETDFAGALRWLAERAGIGGNETRRRVIEATYDYHDADGTFLFQVCRHPPHPNGRKIFSQRRPDGRGGWIEGPGALKGVKRVLYHLPELQGKEAVCLVEGEKDADQLWSQHLPATTSSGGATKGKDAATGKWRSDYTDQLIRAGVKRVAILPDNDDPGRAHAQQVAASCYAAGLEVRIVALPDVPPKGDVSNYLDRHTKDELKALIRSCALYEPTRPVGAPTPTGTAPKRDQPAKPKQGRGVQFEEPEPWPAPVDSAALLTAIVETFSRYLALPAHASTALALWVLHAYTFSAWFISPFLAITSPVKRCGKTLLLIVLGALVPRWLFASNVTPSVLFRTIEKYSPTLLIDEADTFVRDNDELRGVLNSGHTRTTAVVIRTVGEDHEPRAFSTWCPKTIALIGKLPDTLTDRAIEIRMRRRTAGEHVERLRQDRIEALCHDIRRQAVRWADDHLNTLPDSDPSVPDALNDRAADCWRPLLAIAHAVGGDWPTRAREAALALSGESDDEDVATLLLRDIQTIFAEDEDPEVLASSVLVERLIGLDTRPWAEWSKGRPLSTAKLARMLGGYGIHPAGNIRIGTKVLKGYRRAAFVETWERYVAPPEGGDKALQGNKANEYGVESAKPKRYIDAECSALKSVTNPMNTEQCSAVAVQQGGKGDDATLDQDEEAPWLDI